MLDERINDESKDTEKSGANTPEEIKVSSSSFKVAENIDDGNDMSASADVRTGETEVMSSKSQSEDSEAGAGNNSSTGTEAGKYGFILRDSADSGSGSGSANTKTDADTSRVNTKTDAYTGRTGASADSDTFSAGTGTSGYSYGNTFRDSSAYGRSSYTDYSSAGSSAGSSYGSSTGSSYGSSAGSSAGSSYGSSSGSTYGAGSSYNTNTGSAANPYSGTSGSGSSYGSSAGSSAGSSYGSSSGSSYGAGSSYTTNTGSAANPRSGTSGSGSSYGTSTGSGYGAGSSYNTNTGSGANAYNGNSAGSGSGPNLMYSGERKQERPGTEKNAGTGHYYNYNRNDSRSGAPVNRNDSNRSAGGKKKKSRLAVVAAVILVFVLGAGVGSYMSGRGSSSSIQSSSSSAMGKAEESVKTGNVKEGNADEASEKTAEESGQADNTDQSASETQESFISGDSDISTVEKVDPEASGANDVVAEVAENVMPAIVSVYNKYTEQAQFFGQTYTQESESAGSGIIIGESDGELLIVTNNHVVEGADSLSVQFIDEQNCEAALKGTDAASDLAVIAVKTSDLSAETREAIAVADLGDSDALRIGEQVIAIGNALGYGQSVTAGFVSALNREFSEEDGITGTFIQTDAAINPGNSGGALLNAEGQVIGINSNKIGGDAVEGMGFAIPISKAIPIIDNLKEQESKTKVAEEERGVLGIYGISVTSDVASAYGLPVGAYVEEIIDGSGASNSELMQGDIITAINGTEVTSMESLSSQMTYYTAGTEVTLTVQHPVDGGAYEEREIKVTLSKSTVVQPQDNENGEKRGWEQEQSQEIPYNQDSSMFEFPFGF